MDVTEANDKPFNFKTPLLISKGSAETLSSKIYTIYNKDKLGVNSENYFSNEDGKYTETFFAPKPGDEVRMKRKNANGHEMESPSNSETLILVVGHIISNLAPANFEKLKNMPFKTFKSFAENVVKATDKAKGNEIKIKLIGNKENKARAPYCVSVFKPGEAAVISNDFIGEKLYFSNFELTQMKNMQEAVPTNIGQKIKNLQNSSIEVEDDYDDTSEEETLDFDLL